MRRHARYLDSPWWSRRQTLLGLLCAIIALSAWWLMQTQSVQEPASAVRARLPDYIVKDFSAVETNASGMPIRRLVAQELRHYTDETLSELDQPRMELFQTEGTPWRARARTGTILAGGEQVRLSKDVELHRAGDAHSRPAHLETALIDIWRAQGLAETDLPVRIRSDGDSLEANGMQLWYNEPTRTTFHGRARIRLAPEQEAPP